MAFWKVVTLACTASIFVDAKWLHHQKRDISTHICDLVYNTTNKVQCYCIKDNKEPPSIRSADCYLTKAAVTIDDSAWSEFKTLNAVHKITFTNTRGIPLNYVPTEAIKETTALTKLDIKYGVINTIGSFAFANLSSLEDITLRDNQIAVLDPYAFIHHKDLKIITLDTNNIAEINRNVFVDLPALQKLYLTNNQISIIRDRAFINLTNLKELEIDRNKLYSLNFAVFEGLNNLERLDLSSNSLAVIGENTFQALENLKSLNLEGNKIELLDNKAFNGLSKLISLSLAHNKLMNIDSDKTFENLDSLISLSLKANQIKELKSTVMAPILSNLYGNSSSLDVEDNDFPCDCRLDWFMSLMNKTLNKHLKITIENLKCTPDASLRDTWTKNEESEKNAQQNVLDEDNPQVQGADYEYYDETQLNGKLFFVDVIDLLHCNKDLSPITTTNDTAEITPLTNENSSLTTMTPNAAKEAKNKDPPIKVDTITNTNEIFNKSKREQNEVERQESFTTTRLATVSAKPVENKIYENMASDEAKPKIKAHRSTQEETSNKFEEDSKTSTANKNVGCAIFIVLTLLFSRLHV